ncbi:MAG: TetR/AcrR family transcriptional regulator C-terminal domain-containing protein [Dermatophilaceae bacterium]|nr:TetR/AcrR family transcriptional regulator C-terminal domain-containing protein [Intrasporangiaceae bacterium]
MSVERIRCAGRWSTRAIPALQGRWLCDSLGSEVADECLLGRHPWATQLLLSGPSVPSRLRQMDAVLGCFREAGFSAEATDLAYHVLDSHLVGSALWVTGIKADEGDDLTARATDLLGPLTEGNLPYLAEHVQQHLRPLDMSVPSTFEFGLDLILYGLDRVRGSRRN